MVQVSGYVFVNILPLIAVPVKFLERILTKELPLMVPHEHLSSKFQSLSPSEVNELTVVKLVAKKIERSQFWLVSEDSDRKSPLTLHVIYLKVLTLPFSSLQALIQPLQMKTQITLERKY